MIIHKTHSKKDMIDLFSQFDIELNKTLNKNDLIKEVKEKLKEDINFKSNDYEIKDLSQLINHLEKENKEGKIDSLEKDIVMDKAKNIIHFAKCSYSIEASKYNSIEEIFSDCIYISKYGFIPSVRRACRLHNECVYKIDHVNPSLPLKTQRKLAENKKRTKTYYNNVKITQGHFLITFD